MKKLILLLLGLAPVLPGHLQLYLLRHDIMTPLLVALAVPAVLAVWFFLGMVSVKLADGKAMALLLLTAPAFLTLLFLLFQTGGSQLENPLDVMIFYAALPFYTAISEAAWLLSWAAEISWWELPGADACVFIAAFVLFLVAAYRGRLAGERRWPGERGS